MSDMQRDRLCIAGGPKAGKTTLAGQIASERGFASIRSALRHTDAVVGKFGEDRDAWSRESEAVSRWLDEPGPWVIEGVTVARALRKWLANNPEGKPCDRVIWLDRPQVPRTKGQETMAKATSTVFLEVLPELVKRGVRVFTGPADGELVEAEVSDKDKRAILRKAGL